MGFERRTPDPRLLSPVPSCSCCHVLSPPFPLLSWEHHQRHPGCTGLVAQLRPPGRDAQPGIHHRLLRAQRHHPAPGDHHGPLWPAAHTADWQVRRLGQALGTRRAGSGAAGGGEERRLSVFSRPPPAPRISAAPASPHPARSWPWLLGTPEVRGLASCAPTRKE